MKVSQYYEILGCLAYTEGLEANVVQVLASEYAKEKLKKATERKDKSAIKYWTNVLKNKQKIVPTKPVSAITFSLKQVRPSKLSVEHAKVMWTALRKYNKDLKDFKVFKNNFESNMKKTLQSYHPYIQLNYDIVEKVLKDERFKSQFETRTSSGSLNNKFRAEVEQDLMSYSQDVDPKKRPIYGYLYHTHESSYRNYVEDFYGDVSVQLRDNVKDKCTFTLDDSLNTYSNFKDSVRLIPSSVHKPSYLSANVESISRLGKRINKGKFNIDDVPKYYTEAQFHGGVTLKDIEVIIFKKEPDKNLKDLLKKKDVKWKVIK